MDSSERLAVSSTAQPLLVFTTKGFKALFSQWWNSGLRCLAWDRDHLLPIVPAGFYLLHVNVGPPVLLAATLTLQPQHARPCPLYSGSPSLPLLLTWMNDSSLNPWLSDLHTVRFSGSSGYFLFQIGCYSSYGCERRQSMSTYISILAGSLAYFLILQNVVENQKFFPRFPQRLSVRMLPRLHQLHMPKWDLKCRNQYCGNKKSIWGTEQLGQKFYHLAPDITGPEKQVITSVGFFLV